MNPLGGLCLSCWLPGYIKKKALENPRLFLWEQRESNPRPSACKADALNQLSYAPETGLQIYGLFSILQILFWFSAENIQKLLTFSKECLYLQSGITISDTQWGCFGFDSIRHWTVSTPGSVGQPVNLDLRTISWQQLLCTRCVVC